ncbi:MaoC family dehydratase [Novosphingobium rosa]|uniref:MaoC family dehydratase n=1 Tax=Novosphingobium rosa TaxID=76978 RepID=UPI0008358190|nr:MaoC family dehydratase [Novosphingobium rosa]
MAQGVFYEDIEVGAVIRFGHAEVSREEAIDFATKYDPQPFHLDDEAAARSHFGRLAISGWQTGSMSMGMLARYFEQVGYAGMGGAGIEQLRWLKPVYPGDTLTMEMQTLDKRRSKSRPDMGLLNQTFTVLNQHGEPVMTYSATGMVAVREP